MAMYYQGSSEPDSAQIQTLHLMNPNYVAFSDDAQNQDNTLLFNPTAINSSMAHHQFVGFTLSNDPSRPSLLHHHQDQDGHVINNNNIPPRLYNHSTLELLAYHGNHTNTEALQRSGMNYPNGQDLTESTLTSSDYSVQGVILGSKYLKAAQELLDEVASVGNKDAKIFDDVKDKAKNIVAVKLLPSNDETCGADRHELTTAQIQEMQMKKAKLNSMLDEVDQRCKHYHRQMRTTISWFEREAGMGSSRSYTQLALKTILKQFKRLKSAIISQIRSINKSLGDEHGSSETFEGSRLKFIDHQLRHRRSSQQLAMMQNNAWRPQRGLPETAVSVLRAWLFEHFLHPYPKDSDKSMMAKQTGLTRSQVSNWFINARVRLWKPMVEEMYLEEMKNQEQANDHNKTTLSSDHKDSSSSSSSDNNNVEQPNHHHHENPISILMPSPTAEMSTSSIATSPGLLPHLSSSTGLKFPENLNNIKRPRSMIEKKQENSPSSILTSVEMDTTKGFQGNYLHHEYLSTMSMSSDHHHAGNYYRQGSSSGTLGNYEIGELSRFNTEHIQPANNNNSSGDHFSDLSLALPPPSSGNYGGGVPSHRQDNFEFGNGGIIDHQIGLRVDHGAMNDDDRPSHPSVVAVNYELLDFYKRKRYAASHQMLPDFVA